MRSLKALLVPLILVLLPAGATVADNNKPKRGRPHQLPATGAEDAPGVTPDAAAEAELAAMTDRSSAGLTVVTQPGGVEMVDLEGRFMSVAVAGSAGATCHTGTSATQAAQKARKAKGKGKRPAPAARPAPVPTLNGLEVM